MKRSADIILKGGTIANHDGIGLRDLAISEGRIVGLGDVSGFSAAETLDCKGLHILPGVIDRQVHLREPGLEHKEDLESGGRAAVMGGVTSVFEMPNTKPLTVTAAALADKVARATNRMYCDFAFYMGGTRENVDQLAEFERLPGCAGIKVFMGSSTGDLLVDDDEGVARILPRPIAAPPFTVRMRPACASAWANRWQEMPQATPSGAMPKPQGSAPSASSALRAKRENASMFSTSQPPMKCPCWPPTRMWPPLKSQPIT